MEHAFVVCRESLILRRLPVEETLHGLGLRLGEVQDETEVLVVVTINPRRLRLAILMLLAVLLLVLVGLYPPIIEILRFQL